MLAIKLARTGKKKYPTYSLIVVEKSKDPWGDYTEKVGTYNPHTKMLEIKADRVEYWLKIGAQPTATVHNLLVDKGIIKSEKVRAGKSQPGKKRLAEMAAGKKAEEDAKVKAETDKKAAEEAAKVVAEAPVEEAVAELVVEEAPVETAEPVVEEKSSEVAEIPTESTEALSDATSETSSEETKTE